jgi:alpha-1,2-mannosyltransferase
MAGRIASWPRWAVAAVAVLAWIAALAAVAPIVRGYLTSAPDQRMVDLNVYRTSGLSVLQGQPVYSVLTQPPQLLPFTYPPVATLFAVPLALMAWPAAQLVWVLFVYLPLTVVIGYAFAPLLNRVAGASRSAWLRAAAFAVVFAACAYLFPVRDEIRFGQVDLVLLALALADCAAREPRWPRGVLVGLATAIKLVPGIFIVYLWLSGRRRAAVTAMAAALAWTLGAWLLLPRDSVTYWTSAIFDSGRLGANAGTSNQSLRGMLLRVFLPGTAPGVVWAVLAAAAAVAGFAVVRRLARQSREMEAIAVTLLLGVLLSPVSWIHHFVVVVVVIGAILADGRSPRRIAIALGTAVLFSLTIPWWGRSLLGVAGVPKLAARAVEDGFGIVALALIVVMAKLRGGGWRVPTRLPSVMGIVRPVIAVALSAAGPLVGAVGIFIAAVAHRRAVRAVRDCAALVDGGVASRGTVDPLALRDLAVVRYDALSEMSGRLSFSVALLNALGDGVVLSSINGRSETRTYAKIVLSGQGAQPLSPEEEKAVRAARLGQGLSPVTQETGSGDAVRPHFPAPVA